MWRKFLILSIYSIISFSTKAYINIYPVKFEKDITKGAKEDFFLYNRSTKTRKYRLYVEEIDGEKSMKDWVEVYPKSITLKPLEEKSFGVYAKGPKGIENGVYESNLVIKEISLPAVEQSKEEREKKTNILTMIKIKMKGRVER